MRISFEETILDAVTPQAITSSTNATPIVITKASHGLTTGDTVLIYGHATNTNANGIRKVTVLTANTFSLQDAYTNENIAGNGVGGGTGFFMSAPKVLTAPDYKTLMLQVITSGTATLTLKAFASLGKMESDNDRNNSDIPNFGGTISKTNPQSVIELVRVDDGTILDGGTGIAVAGTDINNIYEVNAGGVKYFTVIPTAWTQGAITIKALGFND